MKEQNIEFAIAKNVFYNPEMQFCRSFCSLAVGAIEAKIKVLDAFSATGIRGIRYAKENKNVKEIDFLEANDDAIPTLKKNLKKNKIKGKPIKQLYERHFVNGFLDYLDPPKKVGSIYPKPKDFGYDFVEIDPFGTPVLQLLFVE